MPRIRNADQALRLFADASRAPCVCKTCRAQAVRQLHSTRNLAAAELPFFKRIQQTLFGSKESKEAERKREEEAQKQTQALAKRDASGWGSKRVGNKVYKVAPVVNASVNTDYVPSTTWDGLEHMGSKEYVKVKADRGEKYVGFMSSKRIQLTDEQLVKLLHHITVEILALQKAGRDIDEVCFPRSNKGKDWQRTRRVRTAMEDISTAPSLEFRGTQVEELILQAIPREASISSGPEKGIVQEQEPSLEQTQEIESKPLPELPEVSFITGNLADLLSGDLPQVSDGSISWMDMQLQDPRVKLTIIKRMMQLTGIRIADPIISSAHTIRDLHSAFKVKEKPKKLVQTEQMQRLKVEAPNVAVHARRRTPIDKERDVGRWKVIQDELIARDLPVTGSRWREAKPQAGP